MKDRMDFQKWYEFSKNQRRRAFNLIADHIIECSRCNYKDLSYCVKKCKHFRSSIKKVEDAGFFYWISDWTIYSIAVFTRLILHLKNGNPFNFPFNLDIEEGGKMEMLVAKMCANCVILHSGFSCPDCLLIQLLMRDNELFNSKILEKAISHCEKVRQWTEEKEYYYYQEAYHREL